MAPPGRPGSWFAEHMSPVFLFALVLFGFLFLGGGLYFEHNKYPDVLGKLCIELAIAAFAGVVATLFLSLPDVRHHLASTIATLFSEGKISALLSAGAREVLHKELTLQRITAIQIEPSLFTQLRGLTDNYLEAVHVHNLAQYTVITPYPKNAQFLRKSITRRFELDASHLGRPTRFAYKYGYRFRLPKGVDIPPSEIFEVFEGKIGAITFDKSSLRQLPSEASEVSFEFSLDTEVDGTMEGFMHCKLLFPREDRTTVVQTRYPTKGFSANLQYDSDHEYESAWFQTSEPGLRPFPGEQETHHLVDGLSAGTSGWLLPGEGVMFSWMPKPHAAAAAVPPAKP